MITICDKLKDNEKENKKYLNKYFYSLLYFFLFINIKCHVIKEIKIYLI